MSITVRDDVSTEVIQTWGSDELIARGARVSNGRDDLTGLDPERLIRALLTEGHTVPVEHVGMTLCIEAPVFVTRQLLKHRMTSISEISGRYIELPNVFYMPKYGRPMVNGGTSMKPIMETGTIGNFTMATHQHLLAYEAASDAYKTMLDSGITKEVARDVLPFGVYSRMWLTANLHSWLNIIKLRVKTGHPQHEVKLVGLQAEAHLREAFPLAMKVADGTFV